MHTSTIDFPTAVELLTAVVTEQGVDHVNSGDSWGGGCVYIERTTDDEYGSPKVNPLDLKPSCIVGFVFARLGILRAALDDFNDNAPACGLNSLLFEQAAQMGVTFTEDAQMFLRRVQSEQDSGEKWGKALRLGIEQHREAAREAWERESGLFGTTIDYAAALGADDEHEPKTEDSPF